MQTTLNPAATTQKLQLKNRNPDMKIHSYRPISGKRLGAALIAFVALSLQAQTVFWGSPTGNGGDGNWTDAGWYTTYNGGTTGTYSTLTGQPGLASDVRVGQTTNASTLTVNSNVGTINSLFLMHNNSAPRRDANLIIDNGGSLAITSTLQTHSSNSSGTSHITVNNGGSLTVGGLATLGMRFATGFNFVQNGGTTQFNGGVRLNDVDNDSAVYEMKGGSMSAATFTFGRENSNVTKRTAANSRLEISGGTVAISGAVTDALHGTHGHFPGTYQVIGSGATSISLGSMTLDASSSAAAGPSMLSFLLDGGGLTRTDVTGAASFTDTVLQIGLKSGYDGGTLTNGMTFDLLTATSISATGMTLDDAALPGSLGVNWSIVSGGNGQILQVTVIPEPSTFILLGLAGVATLLFRRKR